MYLPQFFFFSGDSGTSAQAPLLREITAHADRTATPIRTSPANSFAAFAQPYAGGDQSDWTINLSQFHYPDEAFDTIISLTPSLSMSALGIEVDTGDRRPAIDQANKLIQLYLKSDVALAGSFAAGGVTVCLDLVWTTSGARPNRYNKRILVTVRTS